MKSETIQIKGMHCNSCALNIETTLKETGGVEMCEVNFNTQIAKVKFDESKISPQSIFEEIESLGYSVAQPPKNL